MNQDIICKNIKEFNEDGKMFGANINNVINEMMNPNFKIKIEHHEVVPYYLQMIFLKLNLIKITPPGPVIIYALVDLGLNLDIDFEDFRKKMYNTNNLYMMLHLQKADEIKKKKEKKGKRKTSRGKPNNHDGHIVRNIVKGLSRAVSLTARQKRTVSDMLTKKKDKKIKKKCITQSGGHQVLGFDALYMTNKRAYICITTESITK